MYEKLLTGVDLDTGDTTVIDLGDYAPAKDHLFILRSTVMATGLPVAVHFRLDTLAADDAAITDIPIYPDRPMGYRFTADAHASDGGTTWNRYIKLRGMFDATRVTLSRPHRAGAICG